jgi:hypothetical protein
MFVYNMRQLLKNESHSAQNKAFDSLIMLTMWYFRMQSSGSVRKPGLRTLIIPVVSSFRSLPGNRSARCAFLKTS